MYLNLPLIFFRKILDKNYNINIFLNIKTFYMKNSGFKYAFIFGLLALATIFLAVLDPLNLNPEGIESTGGWGTLLYVVPIFIYWIFVHVLPTKNKSIQTQTLNEDYLINAKRILLALISLGALLGLGNYVPLFEQIYTDLDSIWKIITDVAALVTFYIGWKNPVTEQVAGQVLKDRVNSKYGAKAATSKSLLDYARTA